MRKLLALLVLLCPGLAFGANRFWVGGTNTWNASNTASWAATSNGAGGQSVPGAGDAVTFDANSGGGTVTVGAAYNPSVTSITMGAFTGTLDFAANSSSPTLVTFSGTGAGTRTLLMGSGTWTITGNATTVWNMTTTTGLTFNAGTSLLRFTYAGGTGTRTMTAGNQAYYDISVTAGSDIFSQTGGASAAHSINFTGFTGTYSGTGAIAGITGNYTLGAGMPTATHTGALTFSGTSGTQTFTSNGVTYSASNTTVNGVGGTLRLADALSSAGGVTLTNGTLDAATNVSVTLATFSSANSNARVLLMGTGTWTVTSTGSAWNTSTSSGMVLTPSTSTIKFTNNSVTNKTFSGGGLTYGTVWNATADTGTFTIAGSNTFSTLKSDVGRTILLTSGTTQTITTPTLSGSAGNLITLTSTTATNATLALAAGTVAPDYITASKITCTPGGAWNLGAHSTDGGNNGGCTFPTNRKAIALSSGGM